MNAAGVAGVGRLAAAAMDKASPHAWLEVRFPSLRTGLSAAFTFRALLEPHIVGWIFAMLMTKSVVLIWQCIGDLPLSWPVSFKYRVAKA